MEQQQFARSLANPDKAIRDGTVRELKKFLANLTSIEDIEMLKLWKALFYCLWLCDKAPVQEELCEAIAGMLEVFKKPSLAYNKYLRMFFRITLMEWDQLDQHRLNKFYTLIRSMMRKSFEMLHSVQWADKAVNRFLEALVEEVLVKRPNGPRYHICDIYLCELWNSTQGLISHQHFMVAISPFLSALGTTDDATFRTRLIEKVFQDFISTYSCKNCAEEDGMKPFKYVSTVNLQREIFEIASSSSNDICIEKNRRKIYDLHSLFGRHNGINNASDSDCEADLHGVEAVEPPGATNSTPMKKGKKKSAKKTLTITESNDTPSKKGRDKKKGNSDEKVRVEEVEKVMDVEKVDKKNGIKRTREESVDEAKKENNSKPEAFIASKKYSGTKPGYSFQKVNFSSYCMLKYFFRARKDWDTILTRNTQDTKILLARTPLKSPKKREDNLLTWILKRKSDALGLVRIMKKIIMNQF